MKKPMKVECNVCMHRCMLEEGQRGRCRARICRGGKVISENYGRITSLALDPIEKKPLNFFYPGTRILSLGSYGCNLSCRFCQNHEIAQAGPGRVPYREISPEALVSLALDARSYGSIGAAFTYNEPMISWEYVRDCSLLLHKEGLKSVLVTNGSASVEILSKLDGLVDAMNIDLKAFRPETYRTYLGGDLDTVKAFISHAADVCHVELTTLVVPGMNDSEEEMRDICAWITSLRGGRGRDIPLHISRFFPRYRMTDRPPTEVRTIYRLCSIAEEYLDNVCPGNV